MVAVQDRIGGGDCRVVNERVVGAAVVVVVTAG